MKHLHSTALLALFALATLTACSDDNDQKELENNASGANSTINNSSANGANGTTNVVTNNAPETCGDAAIDPGEACDGADLAGETCASLGFAGGQLACRADCLGFDTMGCSRDQGGGGGLDQPCPVGQHLCDAMCVLDEEGPGCGVDCELCPTDPAGETVCASGACGLMCEPGNGLCGGACSSCPDDFTYACSGTTCAAAECPQGEYPLDGTCAAWEISSAFGEMRVNSPDSPDLVVGPDGVLHVAYFNSWSGGLRYARYDGSWSDTGVGVQDGGVPSPGLALDPDGNPHIGAALIAEDGTTEGFGHFWNDGSGWQSELIVEGERPFGEIEIDADGTIHVAFRRLLGAESQPNGAIPDRKVSEVIYGTKAPGGEWELTPIDQEDDLGYNFSVPGFALFEDGRFAISYGDGLRVILAEGTTDSFTRSVMLRGKVSRPRLEVSPAGELAAVFTQTFDEDDNTTAAPPIVVFYAVRSNGTWERTPLAGVPGEYMGFRLGLDWDAAGRAHVSHYVGSTILGDSGSAHLIRQTDDGWEHQLLDDAAQPGLDSDLAFGPDGALHVVAGDSSLDKLRWYRVEP